MKTFGLQRVKGYSLVSEATKNIRRTRGAAKNELWFLAETKPTDLVIYTVKKATKKPTGEKAADDNMISNEKYKITFGDAGLESINGVKISNSILYFNSSQEKIEKQNNLATKIKYIVIFLGGNFRQNFSNSNLRDMAKILVLIFFARIKLSRKL